jgi:mannose-6-phosphate isomerase-like protein (cupin superfamily)
MTPGRVRRVVTTLDANDKAVVLFDGDNPNTQFRPARGNTMNLIWTTDGSPADMSGTIDRGAVEIGTQPPPGGTVMRIIDYPPTTPEQEARLDVNQRQRQVAHDAPTRGLPPRHPFMHRTRSLDYAIILSGEIDMLLDDSEVHLQAGDVVIQQGTNHAWVNRGKDVCRIAFILVDAKEPKEP